MPAIKMEFNQNLTSTEMKTWFFFGIQKKPSYSYRKLFGRRRVDDLFILAMDFLLRSLRVKWAVIGEIVSSVRDTL